jgi:hypothetical protein
MQPTQTDAPIFLVGCPRSGTTLLASHLGRHADLLALPETQFFAGSYAGAFWKRWHATRDPERFFKYLWERNVRLQDVALDTDGLCADFVAHNISSTPEAFQMILDHSLIGSGKSRVVEKTPRHIEYIDQILHWFPASKVICIVRDGRDTVASLVNAPWTHNKAEVHVQYWKWCTQIGQAKQARHPDRVKVIKYEDFVAGPEPVLRDICAFVSCAYDPIMLDTNQVVQTAPEWEAGWKEKATKPADPSHLYKWQRLPDQDQVKALQIDMREELEAFGYPMIADIDDSIKGTLSGSELYKVKFTLRRTFQTHVKHMANRFRHRQLKALQSTPKA